MSSNGSLRDMPEASTDVEAAKHGLAGRVYDPNLHSQPTGWSAWFGGSKTAIGPRICPVLDSISLGSQSDEEESGLAILAKQLAQEDGNAIQYRTCSWQKTAALLFSEYICLVRSIWRPPSFSSIHVSDLVTRL